jgi:hypothetical protein
MKLIVLYGPPAAGEQTSSIAFVDSVKIDSTRLTAEQTVSEVLKIVQARS